MTLEKYIENLPKEKQYQIAIRLARLGRPIWDEYAKKNELTYRVTVVGLQHSVDKKILANTITVVEKYISTNWLNKKIIKYSTFLPLYGEFSDPVIALQDLDWELLKEVERIF